MVLHLTGQLEKGSLDVLLAVCTRGEAFFQAALQ